MRCAIKSGLVLHGILETFESWYRVFMSDVFRVTRAPADPCFLLPERIH